MEVLYTKLYDFFEGDKFMINVVGGICWNAACFWACNLPFMVLDFSRPAWAEKYRIQEDRPERKWDIRDYLHTVKICLINQFIVGFFTVAFFYNLGKYTGVSYDKNTVPSIWIVLFQIFLSTQFTEIGFYYTHRLLHHPRIYKYVHKMHHSWDMPISIASIYCHPIEHSLANQAGALYGPVLCGYHMSTILLTSTILTLTSALIHSGYHFPFMYSGERHDYHHRMTNENFGTNGLLDYLHGTSKNFLKSAQYKRHRIYFTLKPINETYPLESKNK